MNAKAKARPRSESVGRLSKKEAAEEAASLRETIRHHDHLYYVKNRPRISDAAYDELFARLQELEAAFPELRTADSPTARVGAEPVGKLGKIEHAGPMLSLEAVREKRRVRAFDAAARKASSGRQPAYALEPKLDGFSVEVVYERGRFERGATRGNGEIGEDISHNLKTVGAVPLVLRKPDEAPARLAVRGEVFMPKAGFRALNKRRIESNEDPFANPRNAAAGIMRHLDSRKVAGLPLDIFFYEILDVSAEAPGSHREALERFSDWGLKTCPDNAHASSLRTIAGYHARLSERRDELDYEIDGIVVKVDDYELREQLGVRARSPRWAIAWKFEPRVQTTIVEDIAVQVGRTGILTPVALLRPVDVGGVTVSRATLHNEHEVHRKDVRIGDEVRVIRAGDVIPEIEERIKRPGRKRGAEFSMPGRCPVCGSGIVREGAYSLCPAGLACPAQLAARIEHFGSRDAMDIANLGERTARQLVERGLVHDLADLYALTVEDLESLDGFAARSARQLRDAIEARKKARLDRFVYALGIRHVGRRTASALARDFGSLDRLGEAGAARIARVEGVGEQVAASVRRFFADERNREVLARMKRAGLAIEKTAKRKPGPLQGRTFVLTGSLERFTRAEAKERIEALGGRATSSVSGETDYVVAGRNPGSKLDDAREADVEVISEAEFRSMIGD